MICLSFPERVVRVARNVLAAGPMGNKERGADYREFVRCDFPANHALANGPGDIGTVATSCGVFAGAVLHHAGLRRTAKPRMGGALLGNWVHVSTGHPCWQTAPRELAPGDVFYVGSLSGTNGHVGVLIEETQPGHWLTAEGGGGPDGTRCSLRASARIFDPDNPRAFDSRGLSGVYRAEYLESDAGPGSQNYLGTPAAPRVVAPPRNLRLLTPIALEMQGTDVSRWQRIIGVTQHGRFDRATDAATKAWQAKHGLVADGIVGPMSRKAAGL